TLEKGLAANIDQPAAELIRNLRAKPGDLLTFSEDEKGLLAFFVALSLTRVPSFRAPMQEVHSQIAQLTLDRLAEQDPTIREGVQKWGVKAEAKEWASLEPMVTIAKQVAQSLLQKNWQFSVPASDLEL